MNLGALGFKCALSKMDVPLKKIDDGYQAYSAIYHFEYYLDFPCKAVT